MEDEIKSVQRYSDLGGKYIWIYNVAFNSFEQYGRFMKNDNTLKPVFNNCSHVYEIKTTVRNSLMGCTDRRFAAEYSRYRNLGAEVC